MSMGSRQSISSCCPARPFEIDILRELEDTCAGALRVNPATRHRMNNSFTSLTKEAMPVIRYAPET